MAPGAQPRTAVRAAPALGLADLGITWQAYPVTAADMARALYTAYQARDWARAETFLHPDAVLENALRRLVLSKSLSVVWQSRAK